MCGEAPLLQKKGQRGVLGAPTPAITKRSRFAGGFIADLHMGVSSTAASKPGSGRKKKRHKQKAAF